MWLDWKHIPLFLLVVGFQCSCCMAWEPPNPPGETLITGVKFRGDGDVKYLNDKNPNTFYTPPAGRFSYFYADLGGTYNITTIRMWAQKRDMRGINAPFQISTYQLFINPCKPVELLDMMWLMCQYNANFTEKGQLLNVTCNRAASVGQYFRFSVGSPWGNETVSGPYVAEIWIYGTKMHDGHQTPEPEDGPELENWHLKTRKEILTGLNQLWVEQAYVQLIQDDEGNDVALGWHHNRIDAMAVTREKGRIVIVLGTQWLDRLQNQPDYAQFKTNLMTWLTNGQTENAKFVHADQAYEAGDIVVAMRNQTFDVQKLKKAVLSGSNSLIVGYLGDRKMPQDNATDLLEELSITATHDDAYYAPRDIPISDKIDSKSYIPIVYTVKMHLQSWKMMRTVQVGWDLTALKTSQMRELKSGVFQKYLRELLEKYYAYFKDRYPCEKYPIQKQERTQVAWYNYNIYTMAQKSEKIIVLPGVELFPGPVAKTEVPINHRVTVNAPKAGYFYPLGVYVDAGQVFKWKVLNHSHNLDDYYFTFGCHKDNVYGVSPWKRWPRYMHLHQLSEEDTYATPVGGVLFLRVTGDHHSITLQLENVYRHPWYDLRNQTSVDDWDNERQRYNGVPWMAYMGDAMHACLPVKDVVKVTKEDQKWVTQFWDNVVKMIHAFRGSKYENDGFQVFATDVQLSAGWGHSGIPIMGYLPWVGSYTDVPGIKKTYPNGLVHEIGHNLQNGGATFKNGGEVSNNVNHFPIKGNLLNMTAYGFEVSWGFSSGEMKQVIEVWQGTEYVGVNLGYYNWLGMIFGEGLLANLFNATWNNRHNLKTEEDKANYWLSQICLETELNVLPWQELWHFPFTQVARDNCEHYTCFFPDDELTQRVPEIVNAQLAKQSKPCIRQTTKKVKGRVDLWRGHNEIRPQFTFFG